MFDIDYDLEYLTDFTIYERSFMIRRTAQLFNKRVEDITKMMLPKNVMLHIFDNIGHSDATTDTFDIERYPFLTIKNNIKYFSHIADLSFEREDTDKFPSRVYRPKLLDTLRAYSRDHRRFMIPVLDFNNTMHNRNSILVANYNPLYRLIATNHKPINEYYRYQTIMRKALTEHIVKMPRTNFIVVPVEKDLTISRTNILMIAMSGVSNQRLLSASHFYFMMIDLATLLLDHNTEVSTFNALSKSDLYNLNFMFCSDKEAIAFNLGTVLSLVDNKARAIGFINNILNLNRSAQLTVQLTEAESAVDEDEPVQNSDATSDNAVTVTSTTVKTDDTTAVQTKSADKKTAKSIDDESELIVDESDIVNQDELDKSDIIEDVPIATDIPAEQVPDASVKPDIIKDIRANTDDLTPKQKERIVHLSEKYKSIQITDADGKPTTIGEIVDTKVDTKITPKVIPQLKDSYLEPGSTQSRTRAFDRDYRAKLLQKDIINTVVSFKENGLFLTGYEEQHEDNSFTRVKHVKATFEDIRHKKHTINFKLPMPDSDGHYLVNGVKLSLSKQLVNVPICKISPTRVSLVSNYNKTLVDKVTSAKTSYIKQIANNAEELGISIVSHHNTYIGLDLPFDYKNIGATTSTITNDSFIFDFTYTNRADIFPEAIDLESRFGTVVAKGKDKDTYLFINHDGICTYVNIKLNTSISTGYIYEYIAPKLQVPHDWCELKILDKNLPIIFILGFKYGLSTVLTKLKISYTEHKPNEQVELRSTDLMIRFKDKKIVFNRYPLLHSYILSGLLAFDVKRYTMIEFDDADIYYQLLMDKNMSINYLKGISAYFNFFIDPITRDVLEEMGEPTNTRDLLIRAVEMLVSDKDKEPSSISNFRVRSDEKLPAIIYNEIARQYANYINSNFKDASFSINTEAIFQRILQDQTMVLKEDINPVHAIKEINRVTYAGFGGRTSESFVERDRKYPKDGIGILAETTVDSGSVGLVSALSTDPNITSLRGLFNTTTPDKGYANILSETTMLMPGATHDDQYN